MEQKSVIIITGGASGIGEYLVKTLIIQGHYVVVTDIEEEALKELDFVEN